MPGVELKSRSSRHPPHLLTEGGSLDKLQLLHQRSHHVEACTEADDVDLQHIEVRTEAEASTMANANRSASEKKWLEPKWLEPKWLRLPTNTSEYQQLPATTN